MIDMTTEQKITLNGILAEYCRESEVCMAEFLASKEVLPGMTFEEAFEVYVECMKLIEGDRFYTIKEEETIEL